MRTAEHTMIESTRSTRRPRFSSLWPCSPWTVAGVVAVLYLGWVGAYFLTGHEIRDFIVIGRTAILRSYASAVIQYDPHYVYRDPLGYDGQYCYFLALDPANAHFYMDYPAYRYTRIVYPMLARLAALGQPALVPYALLAVNLLAVPLGTVALAAWLRRRGLSPWLALLYGLSPGVFIATAGDLTEPLAYAFVLVALYLLDRGERRAFIAACACFALAVLTRETTAVFPVVYGACARFGSSVSVVDMSLETVRAMAGRIRNPRRRGGSDGATPPTTDRQAAAGFAPALRAGASPSGAIRQRMAVPVRQAAWLIGGSLAPLLAYKSFLWVWLGSSGLPAQVRFEIVPFAGLAAYWPWHGFQYVEVENVVLPALICAGIAVAALIRVPRARREPAVWALLANVLLFVLLLPASSYVDQFASTRIATGVLVAAVLCVPVFDQLTRGRRTWLLAAGALWLALLPLQALGMLLSR